MKITLEISMYPLKDEYIPAIDDFIAALNAVDGLKVETSATSTLVLGDYEPVMKMLGDAIAQSYERYGVSVFVAKIIPGYDPQAQTA
jgi:uncharacterized protein YqgV (UPF0045/DUF77 family)